MKLQPLQYDRFSGDIKKGKLIKLKNDKGKKFPGKKRVGFSAQHTANIIPEATKAPMNEKEGLWSMDYSRLVPHLVLAVQEQQEEIKKLHTIINT